MNCPVCHRPSRRMVYDRRGKRCPNCNDPTFIRMNDMQVELPPEIHRLHDMLYSFYARPGEKLYTCVLTPSSNPLTCRAEEAAR